LAFKRVSDASRRYRCSAPGEPHSATASAAGTDARKHQSDQGLLHVVQPRPEAGAAEVCNRSRATPANECYRGQDSHDQGGGCESRRQSDRRWARTTSSTASSCGVHSRPRRRNTRNGANLAPDTAIDPIQYAIISQPVGDALQPADHVYWAKKRAARERDACSDQAPKIVSADNAQLPPPPSSHGGQCTPATATGGPTGASVLAYKRKTESAAMRSMSKAARASTKTLRPSVLKRPSADGSASSQRTICGELITCYGTNESSSPILHMRTSPGPRA